MRKTITLTITVDGEQKLETILIPSRLSSSQVSIYLRDFNFAVWDLIPPTELETCDIYPHPSGPEV